VCISLPRPPWIVDSQAGAIPLAGRAANPGYQQDQNINAEHGLTVATQVFVEVSITATAPPVAT
jgi:hypothetical protein